MQRPNDGQPECKYPRLDARGGEVPPVVANVTALADPVFSDRRAPSRLFFVNRV